MKNYICINGKKAELTEEQLKQLGINKVEINPFIRREKGENFYFIASNGNIYEATDYRGEEDAEMFKIGNYCANRELLKQRALHEMLNRILWRFACENGELENEWNGENYHYEVFFDEDKQEFKAQYRVVSHTFGPFFPTKEVAEKAIEIIKQFIATHPDFVW